MLQEGNHRGRQLFTEIKEKGYDGNYSHLERLLAGWHPAEMQVPVDPATSSEKLKPLRDPQTGHAISPVIAAALCIKPRGSMTPDQARKVDAMKVGSPAFATMRSLAMRFKGILRGAQFDPLDAWIDSAIESEIIPMVRFARALRRDIDAVRNAVEQRPSRRPDQPTENPQTGHVRPSRSRIAEVANATVPPHTLRQSLVRRQCPPRACQPLDGRQRQLSTQALWPEFKGGHRHPVDHTGDRYHRPGAVHQDMGFGWRRRA